MRLLIISSIFPPNIFGGAEIAAYNFACAMLENGHSVHVVTIKEQDSDLSHEIVTEGFHLHRIKIPRGHSLFSRTKIKSKLKKIFWHLQDYFDPRNKRLIGDIVDQINPDHICVHNISGFGFNTLPVLSSKSKTVTVSYFAHDLGLVCFNTAMFKSGVSCKQQCLECKVTGAARQFYLNKTKRIGVVSPSKINLDNLHKYYKNLNKIPSTALHNISNTKKYVYDKKTEDVIQLLYVGRLDPVKGIDFLLNVLDSIPEKYNFKLTVLGTGPIEADIKNKYGKKYWLDLKGFVDKDSVANYLISSDIYCMPSLWAETYGLTTAMALKIGVPVIGSRIGGTTELVKHGETGLLLEVGNFDLWRECLISLFENKKNIDKLKTSTKQFSKEFDDKLIVKSFEEFTELL